MAKQAQKATLESMLALKQRKAPAQFKEVTVEVRGEPMAITLQKVPLQSIVDVLDDFSKASGMAAQYDAMVRLIYTTCPLMRDKKTQAAYECVEPFDIVANMLLDDLAAISQLSAAVLAMYNMADGGVVGELKN